LCDCGTIVEGLQEKRCGAEAYKARDFGKAITHFTKAMELYEKDLSFVTNRAAVYFEQGDYDAAIKDCELAVERGRQYRADFKMIAKCASTWFLQITLNQPSESN
jgi:stress-induced-phosphoprotein 1